MKGCDSGFAIDANVILRHLLKDHREQSPKAKAVMDAVQDGRLEVVCHPVTLAEVVFVLTRFYKLSRADISTELASLLKAEGFRIADKPLYERALQLYADTVPHFGDACACAAALQHCEGRLLSFDQALSKVDGIARAESPPVREEDT